MSSNNEEEETLLNNGLQTIIDAFKIQNDKYTTIIASQNQKIQALQSQNESLKSDNMKYISQIEELKQKLNSISSTAMMNEPEGDVSILYAKPQYSTIKSPISLNNERILLTHNNSLNHPISSSQSFVSARTNRSNVTNKTDISKYNQIQQRINALKNNNNSSINYSKYNDTYSHLDEDDFISTNSNNNNYYNHNYYNTTQNNKERYYSRDTRQYENKSLQYQKTSKFLKECKLMLNASNFEKLIKIFKENQGEGTHKEAMVKLRVKNILQNNTKLMKMFDNIYK